MARKAHYYDGSQWRQLPISGIDDTELVLWTATNDTGSSTQANRFISLKASDDTTYILAGTTNSGSDWKGKLFSIKADGTKAMVKLNWSYSGYIADDAFQQQLQEMRNGDILIKGNYTNWSSPVYVIPKTTILNNGQIGGVVETTGLKTFPICQQIAVYKEQYVWSKVGNSLYLYDYNSTLQLSSGSISGFDGMALSGVNYELDSVAGKVFCAGYASKLAYYNGVSIVIDPIIDVDRFESWFFDKWNNVIGWSRSDVNIVKWKLSVDGKSVTRVHTLNMTGVNHKNLCTDIDGNYFYSNAGGTWKINANIQADQNFDALVNHVKIRNVGMITHNNSFTGYFPATKQ